MEIGDLEKLRRIANSLRDDQNRTYILMSPNSIGEVAFIGALSRAFKEHHKSEITLVVRQEHIDVVSLWSKNIRRIVSAPMGLMRDLSFYGIVDGLRFEQDHPINTWALQRGDGRLHTLSDLRSLPAGRGGLGGLDLMRYVLHLPWDSKIEAAALPKNWIELAQNLFKQYGLSENESVLLFPGTNSNQPLGSDFWNYLADRYSRLGYRVIYSLGGARFIPDGLVMNGIRVDMPIKLAAAAAGLVGNVVASSSGLVNLMLLLNSKVKLNAILAHRSSLKDGDKAEAISPYLSSSILGAPETISDSTDYLEWLPADGAAVTKLADAIIEADVASPQCFTTERLIEHTQAKIQHTRRFLRF
jgi:hypothetical protein